ncbi:Gamma-glutamyl hydrolase [Hypsibius exemplaris]|uniref:folate gamma-glutamyl hydrolase n=1 Tax=Hypsibius exemplaris TaxID=2072580 RepID=A0A1W0WDS2_HYPEX|nr:Gamma-glutamyl hydrolase [Hypsibius exemplaris]
MLFLLMSLGVDCAILRNPSYGSEPEFAARNNTVSSENVVRQSGRTQCNPWIKTRCAINTRPIIGIVAQELSNGILPHTPDNSSYIAASYVKWVESAGARAVPILINKDNEYYTEMFASINGILFPGGSASLNNSGYANAGRILYSLASAANSEGTYFPIWGTCLGFEFLNVVYSNENVLSHCSGENLSLPLDFQPGYRKSRLFKNAPAQILEILNRDNMTANSHHFCVSVEDYKKFNLTQAMRLLSTSTSPGGEVFVSSVEVVDRPFYGVQFHPEKSNFEWMINSVVSHSAEGVLVSQYFANFFVSEARKNLHRFYDLKKEQNALIYNWNPVYSKTMVFDQVYVF